jgi:hypothetical protein
MADDDDKLIPSAFCLYVSRADNGLWHVACHDKTNILTGLQIETTSLSEALSETAKAVVRVAQNKLMKS